MKLSVFYGLKAAEFNFLLAKIRQRLQSRDLLGFTLEDCSFEAKDTGTIDGELLLCLCQKAYQVTINRCRFQDQLPVIQQFVVSLAQTTASLSELSLQAPSLFSVEMQNQLFDAIFSNGQMLALTKLYFFEMESLPENPDLVRSLAEYLQHMN